MSEIPHNPPPLDLPPPLDSAATDTGLSPTLAAGLACIFPLVGGLVFYILEKRNSYVRFYALQSLYFWAASFIFSTAVSMLGTVFLHIPLLGWIGAIFLGFGAMVVSVALFVVWVIQIVKAFSGTKWEMPVIGKYASQHLATGRFPFGSQTTV